MQRNIPNKTKKIRIPLFWKFTIGMVIVVVLFGSINVALVHRIIFSSLEEELEQRGVFMSQIISQRAINYMLYDDVVALNILLDEVKASDESIEYILVCDPNCNVMAHTFDADYPQALNHVHNRQHSNEVLTEHVRFIDSDKIIRDISIPLLDGSIGFLRVGITEDNIARTLDTATKTLLGMIFILILISLAGTFLFSYLVTSPVKDISYIVEGLNIQSIRDKKIKFVSRYPTKAGKFLNKLPGDEIDILVSKFNEMVFRLQQAYGELETAQIKMIQAEKLASIGTLAAGVAHEVNNPLAGVMNCISRMKKNPENIVESQKYLELMEEATLKMETVIQNLLNFARQPGKERTNIQIEPTINNALLLAAHKQGENTITLDLDEYAKNAILHANKNQLEQVFLNLFINAMDAIAEKKETNQNFKGEIKIVGKYLSDQQKVILEIEDNGSGIQQKHMNKIIDPFFTTKAVGKGTGLGLSVSINIIHEHGGELEIKSKYTVGTTVRIVLPVTLI